MTDMDNCEQEISQLVKQLELGKQIIRETAVKQIKVRMTLHTMYEQYDKLQNEAGNKSFKGLVALNDAYDYILTHMDVFFPPDDNACYGELMRMLYYYSGQMLDGFSFGQILISGVTVGKGKYLNYGDLSDECEDNIRTVRDQLRNLMYANNIDF